MHKSAAGIVIISVLACAAAGAEPPATAQDEGPDAALRAALAGPGRLPGDLAADARRKPVEVLAFFGIEPGMKVLDMFSGGGYYTAILAGVVGDGGQVWAHNNTPYLAYARRDIAARYTPGAFANVKRFTAENNELDLPAESFDAALLILSYHDVYHVDEANGWSPIDGPKMLAEIYDSLKRGAVLGVVDHVAEAGAPPETGDTLHRIDPALAKREIMAAGFEFEGEIDVLRNPDDDPTRPMYADGIRGHTDRFVYRFRKP